MNTLKEIHNHLPDILSDAGFSEDLYVIRFVEDKIEVHFDDDGATSYLRTIIEQSDYNDMVYCDYEKRGKRHILIIQSW